MATNTYSIYGIASAETAANGFTGISGTQATRKSMPIATIAYTVNIAFDGTGDIVTIPLSTGIATGDVTGVKAARPFTFSGGLPSVDETIEVNGTTYTFKASSASATQITIGADETATAANAASIIDANDSEVDAISSTGTLTISAAETGEYGNSITVSEAATNVTVGGATLTGGVDAVVITGDGVDFEGTALPTATLVHGLLVTCTAGSVTAAVSTILKDTVTPNGGLQTWNATGRADLLTNLTITSNAVNTVAQVVIRTS